METTATTLLDTLLQHPRLLLLTLFLLAISTHHIRTQSTLSHDRETLTAAHGCKPPQKVRPEPIGFLFLWKIISAARKKQMLQFFHRDLQGPNSTKVQYSWQFGLGVFTNDPENIKHLLVTGFEDWAVKPIRAAAVGALLGDGIFTTDGAIWAHSRALLRPNFEKHQTSNLWQFEKHMPGLFATMRARAGGSPAGTVDLADVFQALSMDTASEFLMGQSTGVLGGEAGRGVERAARFVWDMDFAMADAGSRVRFGVLYWLWPRWGARRAIRDARGFVEGFVQRAVNAAAAAAAAPEGDGEGEGLRENEGQGERKEQYVFIDELARQKVGVERIRNEVMNVFLAGRETTATLLSNLWFFLVRDEEVWARLKEEVDGLGGELPTYETLRGMKFLKYCAQETLRLLPPVPLLSKIAIRSTTLPRGGGPDGRSPIFIPKGAPANYIMYSTMRSTEVYGADAETWRPSRWEDPDLRPGWNYLAFGGGPRVCLGQQYALTETYYVTIRMVQEFSKGFEVKDPEWEWREKMQITMSSANGVKVGLRE